MSTEEVVLVIVLVAVAWLIYLLPAVIPSLPICCLGRRRAQFMWWELSAFVLPFIVWLVFALSSKEKGL